MTKRLICLISLVALIFTLFSVSYADDVKQTEVYVDGAKIEFDIQPQDKGNDYMMIPIRAVAEHFGAKVLWNETEQSVTLFTQKGTITLTLGSNRLIRDEETIVMWTPFIVVDGRALIHYRSLEDCFNVHTDWDRSNNKVTIKSDNSLYDVMQKKEMVIGMDGAFSPMSFTDESGQYAGFDVELAQEAARRLGIGLKIKTIDWSNKLDELNNKNIDMIWSGMTVTEDRKAQVLFSDPYIDEGYVLVAKKDSQIMTIEQLEKSKVGYLFSLSEYGFINNVNVINNKIKVNLKEFSDETALLHALDSGEIDAFFARKIETQYNLIKDSEKYKLLRFLFDKEDWAVAFRINDIYLRDTIQKAIDEMKKDGTYSKVLSKWFGKDRVNHISYDENNNIIYNGKSYGQCKDYYWRAGEDGERLGAVSQWGDYLKFNHLGMEFEAGVFDVKDSDGAALHINPPNSEFDALYLRSDIKVPELSAENIDRIELTEGYMGYDHVTCNYGTTDKDVIIEFMNLIQNSKASKVDTPYSSRVTVLLYSDAMPGCIYPILLYEKDGLHFLEFNNKLVIISEELLNKLGTVH